MWRPQLNRLRFDDDRIGQVPLPNADRAEIEPEEIPCDAAPS